ncbi:N1221-like protein, partial [Popillia japonica]
YPEKELSMYASFPSEVMDANGNGKRAPQRLRDVARRQRQDSDGGGFEDQMEQYNLPPSWQRLSVSQRKSVVMKLLDQLEISSKLLRMRAARCILYICQGCWAEVQSDTEQQQWAQMNCMLLYDLGVFSAFMDLLNIEIENSAAATVAMKKYTVSLADSQDLRVILSVLYTITEVIRNEKQNDESEYKQQVEAFSSEITNVAGEDMIVIKLLTMVTKFCSGAAPHFPMKKVLLLLWKLILVSLGGMEDLKNMKMEKRMKAGLTPLDEDTLEITKNMRASSPPASASDLLETQNHNKRNKIFRRGLMKQSSLDDHDSLTMDLESGIVDGNGDEAVELSEFDERRPTENGESQMFANYQQRVNTPPPAPLPVPRGLPWKPKDEDYLGNLKESLAGLPQPIHEGVKTLKEHMYTSLADLQIEKEEEVARNPFSTVEEDIELTPAETLYQAMLPSLPQYMIALLKILLAAAPTSKAKTDSINIMSDVLPEEMPMTVVQSMKLGLDVNRHKEIIVKAVSAVLLLLLKHFKLNHVCQFEFMSQHLVFANCIPLVLKFFNQNIMGYVGATNMIPILDFPACVIGDQPELTAESLEIGYAAPYSWRNVYSCINLLRILNKLTKWKHSRIMMLVVFKSAPILKRTLKVRHAMMQLYVLKLLKMQTKYLGRQWRKSNMKTISAIYAKVRHHLNDDWAFGNDLDARPWDFQGEECALRASVDRFNNRRYTHNSKDIDYEPVDNCLSSVLGSSYDLSENFKKHYALWLEQEVFNVSIDWVKLLLLQ